MIRRLNVEGTVTGGLLNGSMTWPRPGLKLAEAFLCVRAVNKNPKRCGGCGAWGLRQPSSGCRATGELSRSSRQLIEAANLARPGINVTLGPRPQLAPQAAAADRGRLPPALDHSSADSQFV